MKDRDTDVFWRVIGFLLVLLGTVCLALSWLLPELGVASLGVSNAHSLPMAVFMAYFIWFMVSVIMFGGAMVCFFKSRETRNEEQGTEGNNEKK